MVVAPQIYTAKVMHKRFFPRENQFRYQVYYLALPLPAPPISSWFARFEAKDVGKRDGSDPLFWVRSILADYRLNDQTRDIVLLTMPRVLGYVFNPISFYLCFDQHNVLIAVLCEVHNTFGEQHTYLCANPDHSPIKFDRWMEAEKVFHVSPFLPRSGHYKFRFDLKKDTLGIWIDFYDSQQKKQLITSLIGSFSPLTRQSLRGAFWRHPMVTLKTILLIHWQALKLLFKGIKYLSKPDPLSQKITVSRGSNKPIIAKNTDSNN